MDTIESEELSFAELYSSILLNTEVIITIPPEEVERVKTGLKNFKAKLASKQKEDGLTPDPSTFSFSERVPEEEKYKKNFIDLVIQLARKSTIKVMQIKVPDNEF